MSDTHDFGLQLSPRRNATPQSLACEPSQEGYLNSARECNQGARRSQDHALVQFIPERPAMPNLDPLIRGYLITVSVPRSRSRCYR